MYNLLFLPDVVVDNGRDGSTEAGCEDDDGGPALGTLGGVPGGGPVVGEGDVREDVGWWEVVSGRPLVGEGFGDDASFFVVAGAVE